MSEQEMLTRGFEYDLWANLLWINALGHLPEPAKCQVILEHIYRAQKTWLKRIGIDVVADADGVSLGEVFTQLQRVWLSVLEESDLSAVIEYETFSGEPFSNSIGEIAAHVINHGTYHRGHLRGLCDAANCEQFPETDFIRFLRN